MFTSPLGQLLTSCHGPLHYHIEPQCTFWHQVGTYYCPCQYQKRRTDDLVLNQDTHIQNIHPVNWSSNLIFKQDTNTCAYT